MHSSPAPCSIVIPLFNGAGTIGALLDSIGQLDPAPSEVIVIDDASTDDATAIVACHEQVRLIHHQQRKGAGASRNSGARAASGEWLLFVDADTRLVSTSLIGELARLIEYQPGVDAFSGCYLTDNHPPHHFGRFLDRFEEQMRHASIDTLTRGGVNGSLFAIRRERFLQIGGFDEHPAAALENLELGYRLDLAGGRHFFSSQLRVWHLQPDLTSYLGQLIPRMRHYFHLLRHYHHFNEVMGGRESGLNHLAILLTILSLPLASSAAGIWPTLLLLSLSTLFNRQLLTAAIRQDGILSLPRTLLYLLLITVSLAAGGVLGTVDAVRERFQRLQSDLLMASGYLRSLLSTRVPGYLIHFLTHRCNARCRHCFDHRQRETIERDQELDSVAIAELTRHLRGVAHLSLTGGEPMLRNDLDQIVASYYRHAGVRSFSINSNGALPQRTADTVASILKATPGARLVITLSVDGLFGEHDRLRSLPGLFRQTMESYHRLDRLRQWHPRLHLHLCLTLSEANQGSASSTIDYLKRLSPDAIELNLMRGTPDDSDLKPASWSRYEQLHQRLRSIDSGRGVIGWLLNRLDTIMRETIRNHHQPWPAGPCLAGRRLAVIRANGDLLPCEMIDEQLSCEMRGGRSLQFGNLAANNYDLPALMESEQADEIRRIIDSGRCRCSFECAIFTTIAYRPWRLASLLFVMR